MEKNKYHPKLPVRILHVVGSLGIGGIQSYVMNLYRNMDRDKIQFDFVVHIRTDISYENEIANLGGRVFYLPNDCFVKQKWLTYLKFWMSFFKKHPEYCIIHGHLRSAAFIYLLFAKIYKRVTIAHSHATDNGPGLNGVIKTILQYPVRYISQYYMGCSKKAVSWMFGTKKANSSNCKVLFNGIEVNKYAFNSSIRDSIRKSLNIPENAFVVGSVGRLVYQKNHIFLIKIFKELIKLNENSWLLIVGEGPLLDSMKLEAANTKNIIFLCARTDVPNLLQGFDVFVMPSIKEGLGIAAIEAQAAGLPTIVSCSLPNEAFITPLISKKRLDESPKSWANLIIEKKDFVRKDTSKLITQQGYDIVSISTWLTNFYNKIV